MHTYTTLKVVGGSETTPSEEDVNGVLRKWRIKAGKTMFSSKTTIKKEMLEYIRDENTPKEAGDTFVTLFSKKNDRRLQLLESDQSNVKSHDKGGNKNVDKENRHQGTIQLWRAQKIDHKISRGKRFEGDGDEWDAEALCAIEENELGLTIMMEKHLDYENN
ncbi:hypothetical protein LXL04_027913 [Taraxacum kok-saghyz]